MIAAKRALLEHKAAVALSLGLIAAIFHANVDQDSYHTLIYKTFGTPLGPLTVHDLVSHILMAIFFLVAAKEVREAFLRKGALRSGGVGNILFGTAGGVIVPAVAFYVLAKMLIPEAAYAWPVATATDIAFAMVIGSVLLGKGPALTYLITLAIVDDGIGVMIIGLLFTDEVSVKMGLWVAGALFFSWVMPRIIRPWVRDRGWPLYVLCGVPALLVFVYFHVPAPIAMVLVVCFMPHEDHDFGPYATEEHGRKDALNRMADFFDWPQVAILAGFAYVSAGIPLSPESLGYGTLVVVLALTGGKFLGISLGGLLGNALGFTPPLGMALRQLLLVAALGGIGFTVAILVIDLADLPDPTPFVVGAVLTLLGGLCLGLALKPFVRTPAPEPELESAQQH